MHKSAVPRSALAITLTVTGLAFAGACAPPPPATNTPPPAPSGSTGPTAATGPATLTEEQVVAAEACPAPSGPGTSHQGTLTADETWTAAGNPHRIDSNLVIYANVTLEPCVVVSVKDGVTIYVGGTQANEVGKLTLAGSAVEKKDAQGKVVTDANGEPEYEPLPVIISAESETTHFGGIRVGQNGQLDMQVAVINRGGANTQNNGGAIMAFGSNDGEISKKIRAVIVFVLGSKTYGVNLVTGAAFTDDSQYLYVSGSGSAEYPYAVAFSSPGVGTLPKGGSYSGNVKDVVYVDTRLNVNYNDGFADVGIPYLLSGVLSLEPQMAGGAPPVLTVEPGVTLQFQTGGGLQVGDSSGQFLYPATLVARGTADKPITFTSASETPQKGDWKNLWFKGATATGNAIDHAVIEYAGGNSGASSFGCGPGDNDSAVFITEQRPSDAFITNTRFRQIGGENVIVSGWVSDETGPDLTATNSFEDSAGAVSASGQAGCTQTLWRATDGSAYCPDTSGSAVPYTCFID